MAGRGAWPPESPESPESPASGGWWAAMGGVGMAGLRSQDGPEVFDCLFVAPESGKHRGEVAPTVEPPRAAHTLGEGIVRRMQITFLIGMQAAHKHSLRAVGP